MRLLHTQLISVLPEEQLMHQWDDLFHITMAIQKNDPPNHLLVNFILDYPFDHFISYAYYVREEMIRRGYHVTDNIWKRMTFLVKDGKYTLLPLNEVYFDKMNHTYLLICYYNLLEKYLCGGISNKDWDKIAICINSYKEEN